MTHLARIVLAVAAVDTLVAALWALASPDQFFALLAVPRPTDGFLWPVLGGLSLANALCLVAAAVWPKDCGSLTLVAAVGRLLSCGMWLWLLGTDRIAPAREPLWWLLAHDAFWLLVLIVVIAVHFAARRR
jgi:hypothetical protein